MKILKLLDEIKKVSDRLGPEAEVYVNVTFVNDQLKVVNRVLVREEVTSKGSRVSLILDAGRDSFIDSRELNFDTSHV